MIIKTIPFLPRRRILKAKIGFSIFIINCKLVQKRDSKESLFSLMHGYVKRKFLLVLMPLSMWKRSSPSIGISCTWEGFIPTECLFLLVLFVIPPDFPYGKFPFHIDWLLTNEYRRLFERDKGLSIAVFSIKKLQIGFLVVGSVSAVKPLQINQIRVRFVVFFLVEQR